MKCILSTAINVVCMIIRIIVHFRYATTKQNTAHPTRSLVRGVMSTNMVKNDIELMLSSSHKLLGIAKQQGRNFCEDINQLNADNDLDAVRGFMKAKSRKSEATKRQYKKEISRFVAWLAIEQGMSISGVTADELRAYEAFLSNPLPADVWIGKKGKPTLTM